jgi:DNA-binding NtrC family response regulator
MDKPRVLIVDDDPSVLRALGAVLGRAREGFDVTLAAGAGDALDAMARGSFDVIIADLHMAGMDGCAVLVVAQSRHPRAARLVLTGSADEVSLARATALAHEVLAKPCDAAQLRAAIKRVLPPPGDSSLLTGRWRRVPPPVTN